MLIWTLYRNANAIAFTSHRAEVADNDEFIAEVVDSAEADDRLLVVVKRDPLEAVP